MLREQHMAEPRNWMRGAALDRAYSEALQDEFELRVADAQFHAVEAAHDYLRFLTALGCPEDVALVEHVNEVFAAARGAAAAHFAEALDGDDFLLLAQRLADSDLAAVALPRLGDLEVEEYVRWSLPNAVACRALVVLGLEVGTLCSAPDHEEERTRTTS